jgi:hypothetical protein
MLKLVYKKVLLKVNKFNKQEVYINLLLIVELYFILSYQNYLIFKLCINFHYNIFHVFLIMYYVQHQPNKILINELHY